MLCLSFRSGNDQKHVSKGGFVVPSATRRGLVSLQMVHTRLDFTGASSSKQYEFYDKNATMLGTKNAILQQLSEVTGIQRSILSGEVSYHAVLVGKRMSWAAKRRTTRIEDLAYCLLGIFDIDMPLLYGEGPKAFMRLQEEIIRSSNDMSLFAWTASASDLRRCRGMLAESSSKFGSIQCTLTAPTISTTEYSITNNGLRVTGLHPPSTLSRLVRSYPPQPHILYLQC